MPEARRLSEDNNPLTRGVRGNADWVRTSAIGRGQFAGQAATALASSVGKLASGAVPEELKRKPVVNPQEVGKRTDFSTDNQYGHTRYDVMANVDQQWLNKAEHETLVTCSRAFNIFKSNHAKLRKSVTNVGNALGEYARELVQDDYRPAGNESIDEVFIGLSKLRVPPERVHVDKDTEIKHLSGLRSDSASTINTGRSMLRISLDLVFPQDTDVFTQGNIDYATLQGLLLQFKTMPFTTLRSEYVSYCVQQELYSLGAKDDGVQEDLERLLEEVASLGNLISRALQSISHASGVDLTNNTEYTNTLAEIFTFDRDSIGQADTDQILNSLRKAVALIRKASADNPKLKQNRQIGKGLIKLKEYMIDLKYAMDDVKTLSTRLADVARAESNMAQHVVPVVFQSINYYPEPEAVGTVRAQLNFLYFFHGPYLDEFMWKDALGRPTPYIENCPVYKTLAEHRSESMRDVPAEPALQDLLKQARDAGDTDNPDLFTIYYHKNRMVKYSKATAKEIQKLPYHKRVRHFGPALAEPLKISGTLVGTEFSVSMSNRLAVQPILGHPYGTVQYTGSRLGQFHLSITTTDDETIKRVTQMDNDLKALSRYGIGEWRRTQVYIENPYLRIAGMRFFELESVAIMPVPGSTNTTQINLRFVESGLVPSSRLGDVAGYSQMLNEDEIKRLLIFLWREYKFSKIGIDRALRKIGDEGERWLKVPTEGTLTEIATHRKLHNLVGKILFDEGTLEAPGLFNPWLLYFTNNQDARTIPYDEYIKSVDLRAELKAVRSSKRRPVTNRTRYTREGGVHYQLALSKESADPEEPDWARMAQFIREYSNPRYSAPILSSSGALRSPTNTRTAQEAMKILYRAVQRATVPGIRHIVSISDYRRPLPERILKDSSAYPDFVLPTYKVALQEMLRVVGRSNPSDPDTAVDVTDFNALTDAQKLILRRFLPTYADIGKFGPGGDADAFAVDPTDKVSPGIPWTFVRAKHHLLTKVRKSPYIDKYSHKWIGNASNDEKRKLIDAAGAETFHRRLSDLGGKVDRDVRDALSVNTNMLQTTQYTFQEVGTEDEAYTPQGASEIKRVSTLALQQNADQFRNIIRAFPAFKLYFVAENKKGWQVLDDVYSYNSVMEINVTDHKYQGSLAQFTLTNLSGALSMDGQNEDHRLPQRKQNVKNNREQLRDDGTVELTRFPLQEGTRVAIQLGYSEDAAGLETVFTGVIAEISGGDILHVVAQGYIYELTRPVGPKFHAQDRVHDVISEAMAAANPQHFGKWDPSSWKRLSGLELSNTRRNFIVGDAWEKVLQRPYMRNVYVSRYQSWLSEKVEDIIMGESWDSGGGTKTAWDLIQETTLYSPGYVAQVVPYDFEATLFWGRPDQMYYYTDSHQEDEVQWRKKLRTHPKIMAPVTILGKFLDSSHYGKPLATLDYADKVRQGYPSSYMDYAGFYLLYRNFWSLADRGYIARLKPFGTSRSQGVSIQEFQSMLGNWVETLSGGREAQLNQIKRLLPEGQLSEAIIGVFFDSIIHNINTNALTSSDALEDVLQEKIVYGRIYKAGELHSARSAPGDQYAKNIFGVRVLSGARTSIHDDTRRAMDRSGVGDGLFVGTMMINLPAWPAFVQRLAGKFSPSKVDPEGKDLVKHVRDILRQHMREHGGGQSLGVARWLSSLGTPTNRTYIYEALSTGTFNRSRAEQFFIEAVAKALPLFHAFLSFFSQWLSENALEWVVDSAEYATSAAQLEINPRMKVFRQYHTAIDTWDIIQNNITCTRGAMWNSVIITNGDSQPELIDVSDNLKPQDKIVRVFNEPNADIDLYNMASETNFGTVNNRVLVGNVRLAQGIRKMYRGELVLRGNPRIKPNDVIYLYDLKNMIWGPICVERVTHSFTQDGGYVTIVKPECYVEVNNYDGGLTSVVVNAAYDTLGVGIPVAMGLTAAAIGGFTPIGLGAGIGVWQVGRRISDMAISYAKRHKAFTPALVGAPSWNNEMTPVKIFPLRRMGVPWVAALDGMLENKGFLDHLEDTVKDALAGADHLWSMLKTGAEGFTTDQVADELESRERGTSH